MPHLHHEPDFDFDISIVDSFPELKSDESDKAAEDASSLSAGQCGDVKCEASAPKRVPDADKAFSSAAVRPVRQTAYREPAKPLARASAKMTGVDRAGQAVVKPQAKKKTALKTGPKAGLGRNVKVALAAGLVLLVIAATVKVSVNPSSENNASLISQAVLVAELTAEFQLTKAPSSTVSSLPGFEAVPLTLPDVPVMVKADQSLARQSVFDDLGGTEIYQDMSGQWHFNIVKPGSNPI